MRASLNSRKNVRIKWFDLKDVAYSIERKLEISYSTGSVENNINNYTPSFQYNFTEVANTQIPQLSNHPPSPFSPRTAQPFQSSQQLVVRIIYKVTQNMNLPMRDISVNLNAGYDF